MNVEHNFDTGAVMINYAEFTQEGNAGHEGARGAQAAHPLVLLHGGSWRWQGALLLDELSQRYHVYAPDFRGHGRSGRTPGHYTIQDCAADIILFMEKMVREPAVLIGHSLGGQVAIVAAARRPDLVAGLIIGDAPFDRGKLRALHLRDRAQLVTWREMSGPSHSLEEIMEALKNAPIMMGEPPEPVPARSVLGENSPWFPFMAENLRLLDPGMLDAVLEFQDMHDAYDCARLFPSISCPVLIVQGNPDLGGALSDEEVDRALELLPQAQAVKIETVGHALDYPDKEPLLRAVLSFIGET
ncbi:MAG: alpha/beta fold hydrolase [Chloroflexia bacterium]